MKFKNDVPMESWGAIAKMYDLKQMRRLGGVRSLYHFRSHSRDTALLIQQLSQRPDVSYAEPNYVVEALGTPNDPGFVQLWGMQNTGQSYGYPAGTPGADISAVAAWDISTGGTAHVIGIVDTGIDYTHPDLQANVWSAPADFTLNIGGMNITCPKGSHGFNAIAWTCDPMDDNRHGTHVAGTIGATGNNAAGVAGVNWTVQMIGLKFLSAGGYGYLSDAINAIEFAVQLKMLPNSPSAVRVLSNSWGGGGFSQALMDEIQHAADQDILFVAAAGNSSSNNDTSPAYPASYTVNNVMAVAATDNNDALASFSNYGLSSVHLGAPGVNIFSTLPGGTYGLLSGTSMATPHVSGAAMLVLSACELGTADLKQAILQNVDAIPSLNGITVTGGRLNVNKALRSCSGPVSVIPQKVAFGRVQVNGTAGSAQLSLRNNQDVDLNIFGITLSDPQFSIQSGCGALLAARTSCQISLSFAPIAVGDFSTSIQIADNGPNSPQVVAVTGSGSEDPDLAMTSVVGPGKPIAPGGSIAVTATVSDLGNFAAPSSLTGFYLTSNGIRDSNSRLLSQAAVPAIAAGGAYVQSVTLLIPANTTAGSYQLVACANDSNAFVETIQTNNCGASALTVSLADLVESAVSVSPSMTGPGRSLQVADTVTNQGGGDAAATVTQYYLSTSTSRNSSAQLLSGSRAIGALAAGASSAGSATVTIPAAQAPGSYYLLACADDTNLVTETYESNNCSASATRLQVGPDLIETSISVSPSVSGAGATVQVTDTVTNQGGGDAAASLTQYYLSTSTSKNGSAQLLTGSRALGTLAPNTASTGTAAVTIPTNAAPGSYYLLACADDTNVVAETNESNNCSAASGKLLLGPDLIETGVTAGSGKAGAGGNLQITDSVTNQGGGDATASITQYYLSTSTSKTGSAQLIGNRSIAALPASTSSPGSTVVTIPTNVTAGSYYLLACADDTKLVIETNESNNCSATSSKIQVGPDLIETGVSVSPASAPPGGSLQITDTITNQGGGDAAASVTQYYLSTSTSKTGSAQLFSGSRSVGPLPASMSSSGTAAVTLPPNLAAGSYYVLACADDTGLVPETNENNNCSAASSKLQVGPDLIETNVSASPNISGAGGTVQVTETVTNQGGGDAGASVTQYYLSTSTSKNSNAQLLAGSRAIAGLPAGTSSTGSTLVSVPANLGVGSYYVLACADDTALVAETNESNNCSAGSVKVQVGPDLTEAGVFVSPSAAPLGGSLQITDTVTNQGGGDAGASLTQYYLSTSTSKNGTAQLLTGGRAIAVLPARTSSSGAAAVVVPTNVAIGSYYVLACADDTNTVAETSESNNCAAAGAKIQITSQ